MAPTSQVMGAVLCGGMSRRFGSPKAIYRTPSGLLLGQIAIGAMRASDVDPVVAVGGNFSAQLGIPTVPDRWPGEGPLTAVATALIYATQPWVLVTPCDLVALSPNHLTALIAAAPAQDQAAHDGDLPTAVVAEVDGTLDPSVALWPTSWSQNIVRAIRQGQRCLHDLLEVGPYQALPLSPASILDADSPDAVDR